MTGTSRLRKDTVTPLQKRILYLVTALLWLTGMVWLYFRYISPNQDEFGPQTHPAQHMVLIVHGAAAFAFCAILGATLYHVRPGWKKKKHRSSGLMLISMCILLITTGWGLYYIGDESGRNINSLIHSAAGAVLPLIIFYHVWQAMKKRVRSSAAEPIK
jgi:hypothetical protein